MTGASAVLTCPKCGGRGFVVTPAGSVTRFYPYVECVTCHYQAEAPSVAEAIRVFQAQEQKA